jgi:FtsH-binding integral membrane protein
MAVLTLGSFGRIMRVDSLVSGPTDFREGTKRHPPTEPVVQPGRAPPSALRLVGLLCDTHCRGRHMPNRTPSQAPASNKRSLQDLTSGRRRRSHWIWLALYVMLVVAVFAWLAGGGEFIGASVLVALLILFQVLFLCTPGSLDPHRPVPARRLWWPIALGAFMAALPLFFAVGGSLIRLLRGHKGPWLGPTLGVLVAVCWVGCCVLMVMGSRRVPPDKARCRITCLVLVVSLIGLLSVFAADLMPEPPSNAVAAVLLFEFAKGLGEGLVRGMAISLSCGALLWSLGICALLLFRRGRSRLL